MASPIQETPQNVPSMSQSIKEIKMNKKLFLEIKTELDKAVAFLETMYSFDSDSIDVNIKGMLTTGYMHIFKINSMLKLLMIKEDNQSNKILYEEAASHLIPVSAYVGNLHEIMSLNSQLELSSMFDLAKIKTDKSELEDMFVKCREKAMANAVYIKSNHLNNHINLTIQTIAECYEVLKKNI